MVNCIYIHDDKEFDDGIFHVAGGEDRLSTKYTSSLCPHSSDVINFFLSDGNALGEKISVTLSVHPIRNCVFCLVFCEISVQKCTQWKFLSDCSEKLSDKVTVS